MRNVVVGLLLALSPFSAARALTIVKAGPVGEIASLAEANEIRVVFSEPMVAVGKIPKKLEVPWFHVDPVIAGTFRWSGTTTLIFTPDPKVPLPFATRYTVTIDAGAKSAVSGKALAKPYRFSFNTPTIQLRSTDWYRKGGKAEAPIVIALRFNQPVDAETIGSHLQLRSVAHEFKVPLIPASSRLTAQEIAAFGAKVAQASAAAASDGQRVMTTFATEWDKKKWPAKPEQVVVETQPGVAPSTWLQVYLDEQLAKSGTHVRTGRSQSYTIQLDPTLFIDSMECLTECNPESYDPITIRTKTGVSVTKMRAATTVVDITDPAHEVPVKATRTPDLPEWQQTSGAFSLDELGYSLLPAHDYLVRIDRSLQAEDGQMLGYPWVAVLQLWHKLAFISFGDGHGVWESSGGPVLPFHARNFATVQQWLMPISIEQTMASMLEIESGNFRKTPPVAATQRKLAPVADKTQSYGLNLSSALNKSGNGIVWAAIKPGDTIPKAKRFSDDTVATLVQVTNLGLSVKDSPQNTLVFVTRLDDATPVAGAKVSIRMTDNRVVWSGTTDDHGIAVAPPLPLREEKREGKPSRSDDEESYYNSWSAIGKLHFIVVAEKDGDTAYVASNWNDGVQPWEFGFNFDLNEALPLLRGTIFTDRGVYKLGEEVHAKAVLRSDTPAGMQLLPAGTSVEIVVQDAHDKEVDKRTVALNEWSSAEWTFIVPTDGPLGTYRLRARIAGQRLRAFGDFLVAAYRRPEFRVDVGLTSPSSIAGTKLDGTITARYLFGSPMSSRPAKWTYSKAPIDDVPRAISDRFSDDQWSFLGTETSAGVVQISTKEQKVDAKGELKLSLPTDVAAGMPLRYTLEADVTDVSRQHIANRASFRVDPMPVYVGIHTPPYFANAGTGLDTSFVAVQLDGTAKAGVPITVVLKRIQWNSVRQSQGNGFYTWETERKEVAAGDWSVTTAATPAPLHIPLGEGGEYLLIASTSDAEGRSTTTRVWFYAVGSGYTAWERYDHNRIDLVPEKKTLKPGETARIMIKSPWEHATALLTTEREGVRTSKTFAITSTQQTITVPVSEKDIPNVFVSVVLVKGRTKEGIEDEADPGKPAFRVGYTELKIVDASKKLTVNVKANRDEYRPATKARVEVEVKDANGKPAPSEVTLWAVDYGVLSLTGYRTPNVLESIYLDKALQVATEDSREKIVSRRVLTPKGETQGGGGGRDAGPGMLRKDFRVLAFWVGSIATDKNGRARTEITLPESLTTYRIMAVAGDRQSRFGGGDSEIRINKPVLLTQTFPRFLALGDKAYFGGVVHSQLKEGGTATVAIKSMDPDVIEVIDGKQTVDVPPNGNVEVRFNGAAKSVGVARIRMSVELNRESDAFEDVIPVRILTPHETFAAYGEANPTAKEALQIPTDVAPSAGGLHMELSSTAMVGLSEGASYLVDYPYGCAEQRSSAAMALMLVSDLGDAFALPGVDAKSAHATAQKTIYELYKFQCGDGGFSYWPGECASESPYLTANVLHILQRGVKLKYDVSGDVLKNAYTYLENELKERRPVNEGWWPAYTAWQAFAVKVLTEGGKNEDSHITRLDSYADRMPLFAIAYLADAMIAKGEKSERLDDLLRRIDNGILPEGGSAHVEELSDPYLLWYWNSNVRSTAIALDTLVRSGATEPVRGMVRWLMQVRKRGRWGNTQENVWAMESLVDYYRRFEKETPDFTAVVTLGSETLQRETFRGRSTEAKSHDVPMASLMKRTSGDVTIERQGTGNLFYMMRLQYVPLGILHDSMDQGFTVERKYSQATFKAGDLVKVTLRIRNTKERRFVAVTDPIPAGTEPVESWFATTATDLAEKQRVNESGGDWMSWWEHGGFDHVERHDDRVNLFATRLGEGVHEFSYMVRATTVGTFTAAPAHAEEMYEPEVFGRTASSVVEVK